MRIEGVGELTVELIGFQFHAVDDKVMLSEGLIGGNLPAKGREEEKKIRIS